MSKRWQEIEEVLQGALDLPAAERAAFLNRVCAGDKQLHDEARSLVDAYDEAVGFIEQPALITDAQFVLDQHLERNIGRQIGPYRIIEWLGSGGMGEVYLAQDQRLNRLVALKILPAYLAADDQRLRRFQREARAASALNHPNILTIHEVGEADDVRYIATEFIEGETLRELVATKRLSLTEILDLTVQLAFALTAAHAAGIVHRDIKPENIMRRADGIAKILDFGIAKLLESSNDVSSEAATLILTQTEVGVVMGTVGYMSPEQARALPIDERTDIWSLGVVIYEMLTSRLPFTGVTRMDALVAILERDPAPLRPPDNCRTLQKLNWIVSKSLRKERSERYQSAAEMLSDLKEARQQFEIETNPGEEAALILLRSEFSALQPSSERSQALTKRRPRYQTMLFGLALLLLLAVVTGLIYEGAIRAARSRRAAAAAALTRTPYAKMTATEQLTFLDTQEQRIASMMGDRPVKLDAEALHAIKVSVDRYVAREESKSDRLGAESLRVIYTRSVSYVPVVARAFVARKIPVVVGIYIPMIESEYRACFENSVGAKGLFQFLPQTANSYGVARSEMCDVDKMAPAAAHYIADRMAELGDDSQSMTLVLLSYNRGPEWVRDTLRRLRDTDNYRRDFWTLFSNRDKLDDTFRNENAAYVPAFFAAAIIGENPANFDLPTPPLSSLAVDSPIEAHQP